MNTPTTLYTLLVMLPCLALAALAVRAYDVYVADHLHGGMTLAALKH